ncbi:MAG: hypothetical protein QOG94_906 [Solirubrobacteraceae bacterium]|jgi:uncharacterized membrane protein|nr:hypothetical protein [Solirubrobacteraceae bacterium]
MQSSPPSLTYSQLSIGLRMILIFTLIGSCAGASNNSVTDHGASDNEVQLLGEKITNLDAQVRQLRREVRRTR